MARRAETAGALAAEAPFAEEHPSDPVAEREDKDRQFVTAVARGMSILRCWRRGDRHLGNSEIAARTGLPKPTVSRLTYTLTQLGYLEYSPSLEKYALGVGVLALGYAYLAGQGVREAARPAMQRLAEQAQASVMLGALDESPPDVANMVLLEVCQGSEGFYHRREVGQRVAYNSTALGRAYLSAVPAARRDSILSTLERRLPGPEREFVRLEVERALKDYERYGFVFSLGDSARDVFAVGVPLVLGGGERIYALSCSGPAYSMTLQRLTRELGPQLVQMRDQIRSALQTEF